MLVLASCTLATLDAGTRVGAEAVGALRQAGLGLIGPVQARAADLFHSDEPELDALREQNTRLMAENANLRAGAARDPTGSAAETVAATASLGAIVPARVVALGPAHSATRTATIDIGRADGIRAQSAVTTAEGLVGRVLRTTDRSAVVLLIGDPTSTVGARVAGNSELGLLRGDRLTMHDPAAEVRAGDLVLTWGSAGSRPYPPNLPIGRVVSVDPAAGTGPVAVVRPMVKATRLDRVFVHLPTSTGKGTDTVRTFGAVVR